MAEAQIDNECLPMFFLKEYSHKCNRHYSPLLRFLLPLAVNSVIFIALFRSIIQKIVLQSLNTRSGSLHYSRLL